MRPKFDIFPPSWEYTLVSKNDIGDLMKNYAEEEKFLSLPRKILISSFTIQNGTFFTLLLLFHLHLGLFCTKIYRFVQYILRKCLNSFLQSAVDARRQNDENPNPSVVAEIIKLLVNSSYCYQIMNWRRHLAKNYLRNEKTHAAVNSKLFKNLDLGNN